MTQESRNAGDPLVTENNESGGRVTEQIADQSCIDQATQAIANLATLPAIAYDRVRDDAAKRLGIRVTTLDREVRNARSIHEADSSANVVERLEPWSDAVNGGQLADDILEILNRHVQLPDGSAEAITVWTIGTYLFDRMTIWPRLLITSPEKRCGKTTLLELVDGLCHRSLSASNISSAAVFRCIEAWQPTLLLDEADTFLPDNEELRGVINAGHRKSAAFVIRCDGEKNEPRKFSAWSPVVLAMIKLPPGTIADRSVIIRMERKMVGQHVERIAREPRQAFLPLRQKALAWAIDLPGAELPEPLNTPHVGNDRTNDNWRPMFQIAAKIGGSWPERLRQAFSDLSKHDDQDEDVGATLLADLRKIFDDRGEEGLHTREIVSALIDLEERPWSEWKRGNPLTANSLAKLLKPYRIKSRQIWMHANNRNGYFRRDIDTAWQRYAAHEPADHQDEPTSNLLDGNQRQRITEKQGPRITATLGSQTARQSEASGYLEAHKPSPESGLEFRIHEKASEAADSRALDIHNAAAPNEPDQDDGSDIEVFEP